MSVRTRILHLISSNFVGGPERQILHHARSVSSPDLEIWIGSFRDGSERPEVLVRAGEQGLPTLELAFEVSSGRIDLGRLIRLAGRMKHRDFALVCTHGYKSNVIGYALSRITGCPQVGFVRGWIAENEKVKRYERLDRWVLSRSDWVVCVSELQAAELRPRRARRRPPLVIPNAALFLRPTGPSVDRAACRRALGLKEDAFWIGSVGRLSIEKGHAFLLDAVAQVAAPVPNIRLAIVGDGPQRASLEQQARKLRIDGLVHFAGFLRDVQPWMQAFDVLVNPSLTEGLPNVLLEAMALGTPVVATAVGGVPDLLGGDPCGLLIPPGNSHALAAAVLEFHCDPALADRLVRAAHARVGDYSPERQNQALLDLYANVLAASLPSAISPASAAARLSSHRHTGEPSCDVGAVLRRKPVDETACEFPGN